MPEEKRDKINSQIDSNNRDGRTEKELNKQNPTEQGLTIEENEIVKYGETPYRWYVMIAYCLCVFANGFQWVTFSAIAVDFSKNYNEPSWKVNMFSLMYMIIYPFVCIPEGWLIDNYSTRLGIIISASCTLAG